MSVSVLLLAISLWNGLGLCNKECWDACPGSVYSGTLSVTVNSKICQAWSAKTPHNHTLDKDELFPYDGSAAAAVNYCRDPRGDGQPGCFTTDPLVPYEFCDVPICEYTCCIQHSTTAVFAGKLAVTRSGQVCQPWGNQTSFQYHYSNDSLFPQDGSVVAAQNYCRDPDKSGVLWCYTAFEYYNRDICEMPKCNNLSVKCGEILTKPTGWISPVFVNSQFELICHWTIIVDEDYLVNLIIEKMNLFRYLYGSCLRSYIKLYDGLTKQSPWLSAWCGTLKAPVMTSSTNAMFIMFKGVDDRISFNVSYFQSKALGHCEEILTETTGWFSPPDSTEDGRFENNLECWWIIKAHDGLVAQLAVLDTSEDRIDKKLHWEYIYYLDRCDDYFKIYEGLEYNLLGKYCFLDGPQFITSRVSQLALYFYSDYLWTSDGFFALYSTSLNRTEYFRGELNGESGLFSPSRYRLFIDWTIRAREGYSLQLMIVTMDMDGEHPCIYEMLEIYDGGSWWDELIGIYCGTIPPPTITASSQELLILYSIEFMFDPDTTRFLAMYRTYPKPYGRLGHLWPNGDYALPTSIYGCNDQEVDQWQYGYVNISFIEPVQLFEENKGQLNAGQPSLLLGPYGRHSLQLNFCTKMSHNVDTHEHVNPNWPPGQYAVYGSEKGCPEGFKGKTVSRPMPAISHINKDGYIPKLDIITTDTGSRIDFMLCYKNDGASNRDFGYVYPYAVLSFIQGRDKSERDENVSDVFIEEQFFMSTNERENHLKYRWLHFEIFLPEYFKRNFVTKKVQGLKYIPWELGAPAEYFIHEQIQQSAFGRVPKASATELDPEWLMYDLGQSVSFTTFRVIKVKQLSFLDGRYVVLPDILISDIKWSFLSNGATHCLQSVYRLKHIIEISCLNGQPGSSGRYVVLYMMRPATINILRRILTRHWKLQILFAQESSRCNQFLGMNDGSIADFQLTASSEYKDYKARNARPHGSGWCMQPGDEDPFIQVDLIVATKIEGITIYNWWELYNNTYMPEMSSKARGMGVYKFSVEFVQHNSTSTNSILMNFSLDVSLPYDSGQTFLFVNPGTTRYLKIRPVQAIDTRGLKCLRLELIGCIRLERTTNECGDQGTGEWVLTENTFIPGGHAEPFVLRNISSAANCILECQEWSKYCFIIEYDPEEETCVWYDESPSRYYKRLVFDANQVVVSRLCSLDVDSEVSAASSYLLEGTHIKNMTTIYNSLIAVSFGYPFHYIPGYVWSWKFASVDEGFVSIIFTDISLNIFEESIIIDADQQRFSDKTDRIYVFDSTFKDSLIFTDFLHSEADIPICVFDASYNDRITYCRSVLHDLRIIFRTWAIDSPIKQHGRGFRARYYTNDIIFCKHKQDKVILCSEKTAYLGTGSFLGEQYEYEYISWDIFPKEIGLGPEKDLWYLELIFEEFDLECSKGSTFRIFHLTTGDENYCNLNKPVGPVKSYSYRVKIQYRSSLRLHSLPEGFIMNYRRVDKPEPATGYWFWQFKINLCSEVYKKCYIHFMFESISWEVFQDRVCEMNGLSLVSFHSRAEQQFVGDYVLRQDSLFFYSLTKPSYLSAFMGLRRERRENGRFVYEWSNRAHGNRAVTFTAWENGEPSPSSEKNCALLNLKISEDHTWKSIDCETYMMAPFGICQFDITTDDEEYRVNVTDNPAASQEQSKFPVFFNDSSVYYHCEGDEFISILGRCDGNTDCFNGNDEVNCKEGASNCTKDQYRCDDGICVKLTVLCDHFVDCPDASDENCYFPPCSGSEFRCRDGACIDASEQCDSKKDCVDGTDEINCEENICSNWRLLMCDSNCIANSSICDGEKDCLDGKDEENCPLPNSCLEWWRAGYTTSGFYTVYGATVECDFNNVASGTILTRYYAIDYERTLKINERIDPDAYNDFIYQDVRVIQKLKEKPGELAISHICYQSLDQLCSPYKQFLYSLKEMPGCHCIRYIKVFREEFLFYLTECYETQTESYYDFYASLLHGIMRFYFEEDVIRAFLITDPHKFLTENLRLKIQPVECLSETVNVFDDIGFPCGQGLTTTTTLRCLYDRDMFGNIKGCRSLAHLQGCENFSCPSGYYKCRESFCLEKRFICDGEVQCAHGDDEKYCDRLQCRRQYRCLNSTVCLSSNHVCDGYRDCPQGDDERLCDFRNRCLDVCSCVGATVYCYNNSNIQNSSHAYNSNNSFILPSSTRVIDISSNVDFFRSLSWELQNLHFLTHLNLSGCSMTNISETFFQNMYNLKILDLSYNKLSVLRSFVFRNQKYMSSIKLDGNLEVISFESRAWVGLQSLAILDLQFLRIGSISENAFALLHLDVLDLSSSKIERIENRAFQGMTVEKIILTGSEIKWFSSDMFKGIDHINILVSDAYKFCCIKPTFLPSENCFPQKRLFSSCSDLIGNEVWRPLMWIVCLVGLISNMSTFIYRVYTFRVNSTRVFGIIIGNLAIADFLTGLNLLIILSYDTYVRGSYTFVDEYWRSSVWCQFARFLSTVSCAVSATLLCLLSVDRLLVIKFPYGRILLQPKPAAFVLSLIWLVAGLLAALPFIANASFAKDFSSEASICLASVLSTDAPTTWMPSVVIFIVAFILLFCLMAYGIYVAQRELTSLRKALAGKTVSRTNDLKISRNLLLLGFVNVLLYVPVEITGILVLRNLVIPESFYIWTTQIIFPLTSAINPFLYTLTTVIRRKVTALNHRVELYTAKSNIREFANRLAGRNINFKVKSSTYPDFAKMFQPDNDEQNRLKFYTKDKLEAVLTIWRNQHFLKSKPYPEKFMLLQDVLQHAQPSRQSCIKIVIGCLRCLKDLHDQDLVQVNFSAKDIRVRNLDTQKMTVSLECRPKFAKKESEKAANLKTFGHILHKVIQQSQECRRKNVSYKSDKVQRLSSKSKTTSQ